MYHTKVVDYMTETKPADFATLAIKGMPTALITEMNKASSNIESLADKAASKTDPELNPQKRDRGTYCVWARPKDTHQTKLSLSPTKSALPAKVVAGQRRAPNGNKKARPMLYVGRAGQRELLLWPYGDHSVMKRLALLSCATRAVSIIVRVLVYHSV